jgi:hypothetical protein
MTIMVFKTISGDELLADAEVTDIGYSLKDPAAIVMQQTERGVGVALAPYMPYTDGAIALHKAGVAFVGTPNLQMENEYRRIFGSGIEIAPAGTIFTG